MNKDFSEMGERLAFEHSARLVKEFRTDLKHAKTVISIQRVIIAGLSVIGAGGWLCVLLAMR